MRWTLKQLTQGCLRGAMVYVAWCYGGFLVGPLAVAWDRAFSVPLWMLVAVAGLIPFAVEAWIAWTSRCTPVAADAAKLWPALTGPFADASTPYFHSSQRLARTTGRTRGRGNRIGRTWLR